MIFRDAGAVCCLALAALSFEAVAQPVVEVQASAGIAVSDVPVAPEMAWLRDLVLQVLLSQSELAQASAENRVSRARWNEARAGALPQLGLSASVGQENQYLEARTNRFNEQYSMQWRVTQPLYDAGITARIRQTRANTWGADWSMVQVREQVMVRTLELYAELVRQSRLTELARDNLKLHRQYVGQMKDIARVDLGRASDLPVAQSRVALAESVLTNRLQRLEQARISWRAHTNLPSPEESAVGPLATVLRDLPMVDLPRSVELAVQDAISVHPLLQKSLADLVSAQESIGVAAAAAKPRMGAELSERRGSNYGGIFGDQRTLYAGVNVQWNFAVSDRFSQRAASENMRAAQEAVDTQALRIRSSVESQWYELKAAEASLLSYQDYAEQALSVSQSYAEQFRIGRRSLLDVLNAENELFTARSNALTTKIDAQLAQWRLTSLRGLLAEELGL
jgi:adhesin transport system outer membrane protein